MDKYNRKLNESLFLAEFYNHIKLFGFKKTGKTFWKNKNDIKFLINFQKSQWDTLFYINIGFYFESLKPLEKKVPKDYEWHFCNRINSLIEMPKVSLEKLTNYNLPEEKIVISVNELFSYFKNDIIPLMDKIGNYSYLKNNFSDSATFKGFIIQNLKSSDFLNFFQKKSN